MHTPLPAYGVAALLALTLTGSVAPDARPLVPAAGVAAAYRQAAAAMAAAGEPYVLVIDAAGPVWRVRRHGAPPAAGFWRSTRGAPGAPWR